VGPRLHGILGQRGRRCDFDVDVGDRDFPARSDELPVELAGVGVALGRADGVVLEQPGRIGVAGAVKHADLDGVTGVGHLVGAGRARLGGVGVGRERVLLLLGTIDDLRDGDVLDAAAAGLGNRPVHEGEVAIEGEGALLGDVHVAVVGHLRGDVDRPGGVLLGQRDAREHECERE